MSDPKRMTFNPWPVRPPPYTVDAPGYTPVDGETIPRRNARSKDQLRSRPIEDVATIYDLVKYSAAKYGNARALGSRKILRTHVETKKVKKIVDGIAQEVDKKWTFFELSGYQYMSFVEYEQRTLQLGAGLRQLGLKPGDKLQIYAATSPYWLSMAHGEFHLYGCQSALSSIF